MEENKETSDFKPKSDWSVQEALDFANTLANHGWTREANADTASSCIYSLCRLLKERGNAAALREALEPWIAFAEWLLENAGKDGLGAAIRDDGPVIRQRLEELRAALAKPPRNCDKYGKDEVRMAYHLHGEGLMSMQALADWMYAPATEGDAV